MKTKLLYSFFVFLFFVLFSCKNKSEKEIITSSYSDINKLNINLSKNIQKLDVSKSATYVKYNLTLPIEIFNVLDESSNDFEILNSTKNINKYEETIFKSFNLGVYSADLAYSVQFNSSQYFTNYFDAVKQLSSDLDISQVFTYLLINRISFNRDNSDSLKIIADEIYNKTCNILEESERINILPFIIAGAWVESMYILTQTAENEKTEDLFVEILNQRKSVDYIINYMNDIMAEGTEFKQNKNIFELIKSFEEIKNIYDLSDSDSSETITNEQFTELKNKIEQIRKLYI